jgi:anti-sigma factor RsiW
MSEMPEAPDQAEHSDQADSEMELLSAYIDGELSAEESATLQARVSANPKLSSAIEQLRADRSVRSALWQSFEPDEVAVGRLIDRVDRAIDRQTAWAHRLANLRIISSAAACIVVGLFIGRVAFGPRGGPIDATSSSAPIGGVQTIVGPAPVTTPAQVRIVDSNNNPVALQPFNSNEDLQRFLDDLRAWQQAQEQAKQGQGFGVPLSEKF